ncbi:MULTISPECIES: Blp family class II bacteriocin [Bacillus]|uniref:Blp family class II bacteriocin n=1 Tax=Bacillus TaxID=1386 RepID=UPI00027989F5|nr:MULTISPECIES: Blp family class II bacteriocin [Bacillus]OUB40511.1 bacteriocin leader domain-containing protein [Bacillus thuringiensis serovar argentinensis]EJR93267.1 hypothetical protein IKM_05998 [Bacillus mycoides]KAA6458898.1 bacteriocin leader domain-containing protein [Bacillus cereus]KAB2412556.1 bacteriocin [Bacillus cereus]KAB2435190.1 bacteriocin [Bacillus cereus]
MKEINNTLTQLSEEELENINGGGCTWKKAAAEAAGGIIIGSMGGPWGALGGGVTGAALCYLND